MLARASLSVFLVVSSVQVALTASPDGAVKLSYGSFQGNVTGNLVQFLGIPYAAPPTGKLRFALPQPPLKFTGVHNATTFGYKCPQLFTPLPPNVTLPGVIPAGPPVNSSEDCLTLNVVRPAEITRGRPLPVLFYIHGGGFEIGASSAYDGSQVVNRSIALGEPVIYVSLNYRLNAFGFLGGKEIQAAGLGNAGLHDQRFALKWVQQHIAAFGGDPRKVTIWGESAGAVSIGSHMVINEGNPQGLFSAGIMESGSPMVLPHILHVQNYFDKIADASNCTQATHKLDCLRDVPYTDFMKAVNLIPSIFAYQSLMLAFQPMVDGRLIVRDPQISLQLGRYARVPFITGDAEDEGTEFSISMNNVTTNEQFLEYMKKFYYPRITPSELQELAKAYPEDPAQGSPFNTGTANAITPQFKRLAAVQGDAAFQAPRRFYLSIASRTQPAYGFRYLPRVALPQYGSVHGGDLAEFFGWKNTSTYAGTDAIVYFAHTRNPNAPKNSISLLRNITWPTWSSSRTNPPLLTFLDAAPYVNITSDTYRKDAMNLLTRLSLKEIGNGL